MKKLSKLMAVLLALLMVVSSALADGEVVSIDSNAYQTATAAVEADSTVSTNWLGELIVAYLNDMTVEERQTVLQNWNTSMGGAVGQMTLEAFQNYYNETHPTENLICTCAVLDAYGNITHDADCRWHFSALPAEDQQTVLADKLGGADVLAAWQSEQEVTEEMMLRAMNASSLQSIMVEGDVLVSVYTGQPIATYDAETGMVTDIATGLQFHMDELTASSETNDEVQG